MSTGSASSAEAEKKKDRKVFGFLRKKSKGEKTASSPAVVEERDDTLGEDSEREGNRVWNFDKRQKSVVYKQFSEDPKAVLEVNSEDGIPEIKSPDDVVVKVMASTVSYNDCLLRRGICFNVVDPVCLPASPGMDVVGNIVSVGSDVTNWKEGDRVAALVQTGGNARFAVIPQNSIVSAPRSLDPAEAACMVSTYMTAYQSLKLVVGKDRTLVGKTVLVIGSIGPTGQALIQMSRRAGAKQVFATAPEKMHRYVQSVMGATPLPVEPEEWLPLVEGQMDVVLDGVCQDGFESPRKALTEKGTLVCVGMAALLNSEPMGVFGAPISAHWTKTKASWFMSQTKFYDIWSSFKDDPTRFKNDLNHVFQLLRKRDIKPHVAKRICLFEVADAHVYLELGKARGAIVCLPWKRRIIGTTPVPSASYGEERDREVSDD